LILAWPDALAAITGENLKHPHEYKWTSDKKSVEGSLILFISTFLIIAGLLPLIAHIDKLTISPLNAVWIGAIVALIIVPLEALSVQGSDNFSAPLGAAFILYYMITHGYGDNIRLSAGIGLALFVAVASYRAKFLTASGSAGTYLLAALIFGTGGWRWALPILSFFVLSSILSKIGKTYKAQFELIFEKPSQRDLTQVLANGGLAGCLMVAEVFFPNKLWYGLYLGAIAAVNADTWATEIGIFSKTPPRSIRNFRIVPRGTSGGITLLGLLSALAGSIVIVLVGSFSAPSGLNLAFLSPVFWTIVSGGFIASLIDSVLGATIQAQHRCPACKKITEKKIHCRGKKTEHISGLSWLNNDCVNGLCALSSVGFILIGIFFLKI
jgi:uncharacterized protein (TIGR00297 family)